MEIRTTMGWDERTPVEISMSPNKDGVIIREYASACTFCGEELGLKEFRGKHICPSCVKEIAEM